MSCKEALDQPRNETPSGLPVVLVVAAAFINQENRVLLAQRPEGKPMAGLWEFPGGKVKDGETPEFALVREIEEELAIETRECCYTPIGFASHSYEDFHLLMPLYACRVWKGEISAKEHQALKWVRPCDMLELPMPEADIPLVSQIRDLL